MKYGEFKINTSSNLFRKGDTLKFVPTDEEVYQVRVVKTYPFNLWRRLLFVLHIPITPDTTIKVEIIDDENEG